MGNTYEPDRVFDYTQYSNMMNVNVIPKQDFKRLVTDTFRTITDTLRMTYGPYGSQVMITDQNETTATKDGVTVFNAMHFSNEYKNKVYIAIAKICDRVNRVVGDGTTSCILLAEKIFNYVNDIINTPDDQRKALKILNNIERHLQNNTILEQDIQNGVVKKLNDDALKHMLMMAGNYDDELTNVLIEAFSPTVDSEGFVKTVRNVITDEEIERERDTNIQYTIDPLPGMYRVRVEMFDVFAYALNMWSDVKIAIFDHQFGRSDWAVFKQGYDKAKNEKVLIIAKGFGSDFIANEYKIYLRDMNLVKQPANITLVSLKGDHPQHELEDLCALLNVVPYGRNVTEPINHDDFYVGRVMMHGVNCLCFDNVTAPTEHINKLKLEMEQDVSKSYVTKRDYVDRIDALSLDGAGDTSLKIKGGTSLEVKLISTKIDDCTSIINSALLSGVVPNMLVYGYKRIEEMTSTELGDCNIGISIREALLHSIKGLFSDIWQSKHGEKFPKQGDEFCAKLYNVDKDSMVSFDVVDETFADVDLFPTSAQYDLEVIVAALSIVKYLLTSGAFIFDSYLMRNTGDGYRFNISDQ